MLPYSAWTRWTRVLSIQNQQLAGQHYTFLRQPAYTYSPTAHSLSGYHALSPREQQPHTDGILSTLPALPNPIRHPTHEQPTLQRCDESRTSMLFSARAAGP